MDLISELPFDWLVSTSFSFENFIFLFKREVNLSSQTSESSRDDTQIEPTEAQSKNITELSLQNYDLGRSLFSIPFHPFIRHALHQKGVDIATRTQQAFLDQCHRHSRLLFPLNRGGGRFVALCVLLLDRAMRGERTLIIAKNHVLRRYIVSDVQSLGAFCPLQIAVFHTEEGAVEAIGNNHITMVSSASLEGLTPETCKIDNLVLIEPENYDLDEVKGALEKIQPSSLLGLYQRKNQLKEFWFQSIPDVECVAFAPRTKKTTLVCWPQEEDLISQLQRLILFLDRPVLLICSDEEQVQNLYQELSKNLSMIAPLYTDALRRHKESLMRSQLRNHVISRFDFSCQCLAARLQHWV